MKKTFLLSALAAMILAGCTPMTEKPGPLEGVWAMQHAEFTMGDSTMMWKAGQMNMQTKMFTKGYFSFVNMSTSGEGGVETRGGSGTYEVKGDTLFETLLLMADKESLGKTFQYKVKVSGDTMIQQGPINTDVPASWEGFKLKEVYLRK
jgi:hypothetical protein